MTLPGDRETWIHVMIMGNPSQMFFCQFSFKKLKFCFETLVWLCGNTYVFHYRSVAREV